MIETLNGWFSTWEPIWLFLILLAETIIGLGTLIVVIKEYRYDEAKDLRKKTRTTKKVTESKDGGKVTEETTEVSEEKSHDNT